MIALRSREAKKAFLENRIAPVPQRHGKCHPAFAVAQAKQAVLSPAIGAAARVIVREILPAVAVLGVVFAYRPPLSFREVRPPALPVLRAPGVFFDPLHLGQVVCWHWSSLEER